MPREPYMLMSHRVQAKSIWLLVFLTISVVGSRETVQKQNRTGAPARSAALQKLMDDANGSFATGDTGRALALYRRGQELSEATHDEVNRACFLAGAANIYALTHHYREALSAFTIAADTARRARYDDLALRVGISLATLYRRLGDKDSARAIFRELKPIFPANPPPWLLLQAGNIAADAHGVDAAAPYFLDAISLAPDDPALPGTAWTQLGYLYLTAGRLAEADRALIEGFRLRRLRKSRLAGNTLFYLGMLNLARGDPAAALRIFDRLSRLPSPVGPPFLNYQRARALSALKRHRESFAAFEQAIAAAVEWRLEVPASDAYRVSGDVTLESLYAGYVEAGTKFLRTTPDGRLERRMFEAAELNRAAGVRGAAAASPRTPKYLRLLDEYRAALAALSPDVNRLAALKRRLAEEEARAGGGTPRAQEAAGNLAARVQRNLRRGETLVSFFTSAGHSFAWTVGRHSIHSAELPGSVGIAARVAALRENPGDRQAAEWLYQVLFGKLNRSALARGSWILSVDATLHSLPFAALRVPGGQYLGARRSLRIVPGAAVLVHSPALASSNAFAAFGDPVYNRADPRRQSPIESGGRELARLPGSGDEARLSAAVWNRPNSRPVVRLGSEVTFAAVEQAAAASPAVLHLAAHVVENRGAPDTLSIALGAGSGARPQFLSPLDIAGWRSAPGLVVLSGCASGAGKALPGAGLIGLTRSWLIAGSKAVIASHWAVGDDSAVFFERFYGELRRTSTGGVTGAAVARALQTVQAGFAREFPAGERSWAAYFVVARE